ncbi:collagen-like triple helix repeat-containing protein [Photorhabdus antumapuensis]|uniref:collagen-like triple helix repeat-containing protein n=1 Tax=Photorhabdus antumapuensis TaxID=2862867 RepID=UPI001CEC96B5|nr:collagen-like protein [Photorhabdus antumapuensis]MCA6222342.1 collagen-like protein [Photorhabdus antumapuensis]
MDKIRTVTETLTILHQYHHPFGLERQPKQLKTADFDGPVIFSNDLKTATVPPAFFTVQTIQELKMLGGVPDSQYGPGKMEPHHLLPEPFSAERLANVPGNHIDLCKAFSAYIYGDSALVKDYEEMLNAKRFPMKVAFYSGEEITISEDNPLIIRDKDSYGEPVVLVYNKITIEPEGKVICYTNGRIEADVIQGSSYYFSSKGEDGNNGAVGTDGNNGADGAKGSPGLQNKHSCIASPSPGSDGTNGSSGVHGADGEPAKAGEKLTIACPDVRGTVTLWSAGGDGGNGGRGGHGGPGGKGGDGGYGSFFNNLYYLTTNSLCQESGHGGNGGNGGDGGHGGNGGRSGDGGDIYFSYAEGEPHIKCLASPGFAGVGGMPGKRGKGGDGGSSWINTGNGGNTLSLTGKFGQAGIDGGIGNPGERTGNVGRIYVNGKLQDCD